MRFRLLLILGSIPLAAVFLAGPTASAQRGGMFQGSADDPAIKYSTGPLDNAVDSLNSRLDSGAARLSFRGRSGYLSSVLEALDLSIDAQMLVFSPTSLQAPFIKESNPRALFFNDRVQVGWVRDSDLLEIAAQDSRQGIVFYTLGQEPTAAPRFKRMTACLGCHMAGDTLGIPGLLMFSTTPSSDRSFGRSRFTDHRIPVESRFGGWFVTGTRGPAAHKGNAVTALGGEPSHQLTSTTGLYDADGYLSSSSDITSLMVFSHQVHMTNLLIRAGWEARAADPALHPNAPRGNDDLVAAMLRGIAGEVVDYLLFIDEASLDAPIRGRSGFAERFQTTGPRDKVGRSLRALDLDRRLMRYPCSYLIYSPMFDALPPSVKGPIYERMWEVLSGTERGERYQSALTLADRQAIVEILRDTKPDLPAYFAPVVN